MFVLYVVCLCFVDTGASNWSHSLMIRNGLWSAAWARHAKGRFVIDKDRWPFLYYKELVYRVAATRM